MQLFIDPVSRSPALLYALARGQTGQDTRNQIHNTYDNGGQKMFKLKVSQYLMLGIALFMLVACAACVAAPI